MARRRSKRRWIQAALGVRRRYLGVGPHHVKAVRVEPRHKGLLHRQLGVPLGETIPLALLRWASRQPGALGKRARLALTLRGFAGRRRVRSRM